MVVGGKLAAFKAQHAVHCNTALSGDNGCRCARADTPALMLSRTYPGGACHPRAVGVPALELQVAVTTSSLWG